MVDDWAGGMADLLARAQPLPKTKWVIFYSFADGPEGGRYYDCHPIEIMYHGLPILA